MSDTPSATVSEKEMLKQKLEEVLNFFQADLQRSHMNGLCRKFLDEYGHQLLGALSESAAAPDLLAALEKAKDALYNGFEPDNQSRAYHEVCAAIAKEKARS